MATNGHDEPISTDVNPEALKQGYEPDTVNIRAILYVPVVLVLCFLVTYWIVTKIVVYTRQGPPPPVVNEANAERGLAPINERLGRISSEPGAHPEYKQPRLEGGQLLKGDPAQPFVKSYEPTETGNSPHYHPEDLRPSSELGKKLGLQDYKWVDEKKGIAALPVSEAMKAVLDAKNPSGKPYLKQKPVELGQLLQQGAKASNPHWNWNGSPKESSEVPHQSPKGQP